MIEKERICLSLMDWISSRLSTIKNILKKLFKKEKENNASCANIMLFLVSVTFELDIPKKKSGGCYENTKQHEMALRLVYIFNKKRP